MSRFVALENIMSKIIGVHTCSKENIGNFLLNEAHELSSHKKIQFLSQILRRPEYKNPNFNVDDLIKKLFELKNIRNQLAHNVVHPNESFESAKTGSREIVFLVINHGRVEKKRFSKNDQDNLIEQLAHMRSVIRGIHEFVKEKNGSHTPEWYPD